MADHRCICTDLGPDHYCGARPTQEDLLCDDCREWQQPSSSTSSRGHMVAVGGQHMTVPTVGPVRLTDFERVEPTDG
ncbi:MAG: hypothetical protein JWR88_1047 [Pseudonocardia sp.]|nr:hypothetical protein [Pseudonocardia sp.]